MFLTIVYILFNSFSCPSILFVVTIILKPLSNYPYKVPQGTSHMVYLLGLVEHWYDLVLILNSSMIPPVCLGFVVPLIFVSSGFLGFHMELECIKLLGESQYFFL